VSSRTYRIIADGVRTLHSGLVLLVVAGLPVIVAGNLFAWPWVNGWGLRALHLAIIAFVVASTWLGIACPLTALESRLRLRAGQASYDGGFIEHWVRRGALRAAPSWAFTAAYTAFGLGVAVTWWYFPPAVRP